ncbi:MAG TPA: hypothetical protein VFY84_19300 [Jiangellales bacterium]|nr:hypothetical protein [Jiangellales bacterium]
MIRIPDRAFSILARVYHAQKLIRRDEQAREVARQDRELREHFARQEAEHDAGRCGGAMNGCRYAPCYVVNIVTLP